MGKILGIDLGTTNSCVAVMEGGTATVIANAEGVRTTPSVVAFAKDGSRLVGEPAKRQAVTNPDRTITSIKRMMGTDWYAKIDGKKYTPEEISSYILVKLKNDAESYLGEEVNEAVITVPAYFDDAQRKATINAGKIAGLDVKRIINEPTAAALSYGIDTQSEQTVLVFDLGGGTFDVSVIEISDGVIRVLATSGDNRLGGDDFDRRLAEYIVAQFCQKNGVDLSKDQVAMQRIYEAAENAKKTLSSLSQTNINLPFITTTPKGPLHLDENITRAKFDELIFDLLERTAGPVKNAMADAGVLPKDLKRILLVGGSTRVPAVQAKVESITGMQGSKSVNPDEAVALGAALQGGKLSGESGLNELLLMDVTPLSLSIETVGGLATRLIDRNTTIPTRKSQIFSTAANYQRSVEIKVLQGERPFARDNKLLGRFRLNGIRRALAGQPQIEVTFDIDVDGIVHVSAKDLDTGKQQSITIAGESNMSDDEIYKAMEDARAHEADDSDMKDRLATRQDAQQLVIKARTAYESQKKMLDRDSKHKIKADIAAVERALSKTRPDRMTAGTDAQLKDLMMTLKESAESILNVRD